MKLIILLDVQRKVHAQQKELVWAQGLLEKVEPDNTNIDMETLNRLGDLIKNAQNENAAITSMIYHALSEVEVEASSSLLMIK